MTRSPQSQLFHVIMRAPMIAGRFKSSLARQPTFYAAFILALAATLYWGVIASDRYVSEAHIIVQHTDLAGGRTTDIGSLLTGATGGNRNDQLLLRDYLLSIDMLNKLDAKLNLRGHYSDSQRDPLSRMWFVDTSQERFHRYFLSRVSVELDDYAGVLVIKAQGFDPQTARAVTGMLVEEGERAMNDMAHRLAQEQLLFVEKQVVQQGERFQEARRAVIAYQNQKGLVAPEKTAESLVGAINKLDAQRTELQARRTALLGYLAPQAPGVIEVDNQIDAIDKQIAREQARLTSRDGKVLNSTVEEYQRLEMAAEFAQDVYKTALVALEKERVEATRTLKKISVLQAPTLPQEPLEPTRIYNIVVFILVTLILAGIVHLLAAIVRDHKD